MAYVHTQYDKIDQAIAYEVYGLRVKSDFWFSARHHYDDSWSDNNRPLAIYFHGSGRTAFYESNHLIIRKMLDRGYQVVSFMHYNAGTSSNLPWSSGYGNVNGPMYGTRNTRGAWWVQAGIEFVRNRLFPNDNPDIILYGQSMGAFSVLKWSQFAGSAQGFSPVDEVACIFVNGFLAGGGAGQVGDDTSNPDDPEVPLTNGWNGFDRNIAAMTQQLPLIQHRCIVCTADNDSFALPDMTRRAQYMLTPENALPGREVYCISPGVVAGGHGWMGNNDSDANIWADWIDQLYKGEDIILRDGSVAIPGAVL